MKRATLVAFLVGVVVLLFAGQLVMSFLNGRHANVFSNVVFTIDFLAVAMVGALVAHRQPRNAIGWLLLAVAIAMGAVFAGDQYAIYTYATRPGSLPGGVWATWITSWGWLLPIVGVGALLPLFFPDGRLPSPRWRPALWGAALLTITASAAFAFAPELEVYILRRSIDNPVGVHAMSGLAQWFDGAGVTLFMGVAVASLSSLVVRFRRASPEERQQIKWFLFAATLVPLNIGVISLVEATAIEGFGDSLPGQFISFLAILAVPVAIGVAILKYRLYDIDVIINRTLVYGALTALLALVYVAGVALLQQLFRPLTGTSELAVAGSTLAVAGLFRPARSRIQGFIDRRFYRSRYDAAKTLDEFAGRLRQQTDLELLTADLAGVVRSTIQPAHVTIWLRR